MLLQPKIILIQILICMTGMDTRNSTTQLSDCNISSVATLECDFYVDWKVFDHLTRSLFTDSNNMTVINDL
jgi:hypothetical protein